ncbi:MAG TPA: aminotransferase class I/II-fold pyridoxal phosphate-dependent enzyme [bacterium]|nr:aminotransferase class I/II-fold pyridoxal phosphate-dependent enzyme [bacterium]
MNEIKRRDFLRLSGAAAAFGMASQSAFSADYFRRKEKSGLEKIVNFTGDGLGLTPAEYSALLVKLAEEGKIEPDYYLSGGAVEEMEQKFAKWLQKESALFFPTGTLANHLAIRQLSGLEKKAIVQAESHVYMDTGDCVQRLSGINLMACTPEKATMTLKDVESLIDMAASGAGGATKVGVISIESPIRRKYEEIFDFSEMKKITAFARREGIRLHLDGARLFCASARTGIPPAEYSSLFDTVYISLYKCFNAASGAVLAGPQKLIESIIPLRKIFGGSMLHAWPFAAVANYFMDDFIQEQRRALKAAASFFKAIEKNEAFKIERIPNSANVFKLHVKGADLTEFRKKLSEKNVKLRSPQEEWGGFFMKINASLNRISPEELAVVFNESL